MNKLCSKCHKDFNGCQCDTFHPNITPINRYPDNDVVKLTMYVDKDEATLLMKYFLNVGYISYEDYPEVHLFISRLKEFLES